jgi:hypothetical protein
MLNEYANDEKAGQQMAMLRSRIEWLLHLQ